MAEDRTAACVCGWPETECLRRVLGNGPPFPLEPCEPKVEASSAAYTECRDCANANPHDAHEWTWDGATMLCAGRSAASALDVDALPRRMAHALHAVFEASANLHIPPTAAEACVYDEEAISVQATASALREAQKRGLVRCAGGAWFITGAALHAGSIPFDRRVYRDLGGDNGTA